MRIVLASASPRRRELLGMMGVTDFEVLPVADEPRFVRHRPQDRVMSIAQYKAHRCAQALGDDQALIIAADTMVFLPDRALGKPKDAEDAARMLRLLSGQDHTVFTGVAVRWGEKEHIAFEHTRVRFADLTEAEIAAYVATGEPLDKAGAYGIQGLGSLLIREIKGDYYNVVGLPLRKLYEMLVKMGAWPLGTETPGEKTV